MNKGFIKQEIEIKKYGNTTVLTLDQKTREITGLKVGDRVMLIAEKDTLTIKKF